MKADDMNKYLTRQRWFIERIGKKVFREPTSCECKTCQNVSDNGLIINDKLHATYLHDMEGMYQSEGHNLKYRDNK